MTTTLTVVDAIVETYRATSSFQEKLDSFLDEVLELRNQYKSLNEDWENVNCLTEKYVSECKSNRDLTMLLLAIDGLINAGDSLKAKIENGPVVKVLPSVLSDIENNLDQIKEIQADIKIKISDMPELVLVESKLANLGF